MLKYNFFRRGSALLLTAAVLISIFALTVTAVDPTEVNLDVA